MISSLFSTIKEFVSVTLGAVILSPITIPTYFIGFITSPFTFWKLNHTNGGYFALFAQVLTFVLFVTTLALLFRKEYTLALSAVTAGMAIVSFLDYLPYLLKIKDLSPTGNAVVLSIPTGIILVFVSIALLLSRLK